MDDGRKQFAIEHAEVLPLVEVRGKQVVDYSRGLKLGKKSTGGPWLYAATVWLVRFEGDT